jgi:hypothetical protein
MAQFLIITVTARTAVVDLGRLMSVLRNRNCRDRLFFSVWSLSVTYTVPWLPV